MQTIETERTTSTSGRKLTLNKSFVKPLIDAKQIYPPTYNPDDTYRSCATCSTYCV